MKYDVKVGDDQLGVLKFDVLIKTKPGPGCPPSDRRSGIEHRDGAGLVTVAFFAVDRLHTGKRLGVVAKSLDLTAQSRLVVF